MRPSCRLYSCQLQARWLHGIKWTQCSIRLESVRYVQQLFHWAHPSPRRKRHLDRCSRFAGLTRWQTDWQTDRLRYSVGIKRRSEQRRSQILLLSTATTGTYWSSQLDRSDQLQQPTAISVRLDGLQCMWRRTTIASKRAFATSVLDRWHHCLLI